MAKDLHPGLYDLLLSHELKTQVEQFKKYERFQAEVEPLDPEEAPDYLTRHLSLLVHAALSDFGSSKDSIEQQLGLCNRIIDVIAERVENFTPNDYATNDLLTAIVQMRAGLGEHASPDQPATALSTSDLLVNDANEVSIGDQIASEIPSADSIDVIVAFLKKSGFRIFKEKIRQAIERGIRVRLITTTYMGATDIAVLDTLAAMGAEIRVSYAQRTRLHAKAWLFRRNSGFSTAYVGSSNLSHSAQTVGLEWNVRLSYPETPHLFEKFTAAFEGYWGSEDFQPYDRDQFVSEISRADVTSGASLKFFDLRPFPFQQEILDALQVARTVHGRDRHLIVAATGTGKTVVAALDYRALCSAANGRRLSLLFVAHRQEILEQALGTFRTALRDGSFGERMFAGHKPVKADHVFASVQSLAQVDLAEIDPKTYDIVIVDEFHHAEAPTYRRLLDHLQPQQLLGLTATPERTDGADVRHYFGGEATAELRLWDAIDRGLLVPFQYFGLHDSVDLSQVAWRRGRYDERDLEGLYVDNQSRVDLIVQGLVDLLVDHSHMRALGFCVSVAHARFMAAAFNERGIRATSITGETPDTERSAAQQRLARRDVNVIFVVDVYNEGVDIPEVDTILFLRPTESSTLFIQQLGRGLRIHPDKDCLTVLDFIGRAHREFRFDRQLRALTGATRNRLQKGVASKSFLHLPPGCTLQFDRQSRDIVLESLRTALSLSKKGLINELRTYGPDINLAGFVRDSGVELDDIYRSSRTWSNLRVGAGFDSFATGPDQKKIENRLEALLHIDDPERIDLYQRLVSERMHSLPEKTRDRRMIAMLLVTLFGSEAIIDLEDSLDRLRRHPSALYDLRELLPLLRSRVAHVPILYQSSSDVPLKVHSQYSRDEILAAFDVRDSKGKLMQLREGVYFEKQTRSNLLFVTLKKSEREYSPRTMYRDYALSESEFHWQSQSTTSSDTEKGLRHIEHLERGITPLLFVRKSRNDEYNKTRPYHFLGPVALNRFEGDRPMNVIWQMQHPIPADLLRIARIA